MPARTGRQYIEGLREQRRKVWLRGERVKDVTTQPGLAAACAIASPYDMQHDAKVGREMTYISPTSGDRVGLSFIIPRTKEELEARRAMMLNWARTTCGMMGRSPDFMNSPHGPARRSISRNAAPSSEKIFGAITSICARTISRSHMR